MSAFTRRFREGLPPGDPGSNQASETPSAQMVEGCEKRAVVASGHRPRPLLQNHEIQSPIDESATRAPLGAYPRSRAVVACQSHDLEAGGFDSPFRNHNRAMSLAGNAI